MNRMGRSLSHRPAPCAVRQACDLDLLRPLGLLPIWRCCDTHRRSGGVRIQRARRKDGSLAPHMMPDNSLRSQAGGVVINHGGEVTNFGGIVANLRNGKVTNVDGQVFHPRTLPPNSLHK